jgi:acetoacetyl-CoA synthetase
MKKPLWVPSSDLIRNSNMSSFMRFVKQITNKPITTYEELYNWSITEIEEFWKSIWISSGIIYSQQYKRILSNPVMPGAIWFEGARLNFAENLLRFRDSHTAIISSREGFPTIRLTYEELWELVAGCAKALKSFGVKKGDRVAGFITNIPEAVIAMLAATSLGAYWSSCSPDFGLQGVLDRFGQIKPKILFAVESYRYGGRNIDCRNIIKQIADSIPEIKKVILISEFNDFSKRNTIQKYSLNKMDKYFYCSNIVTSSSNKIEFNQLPFDHPVYIMYSSGTTDIPKCIVHGSGGTLLQHYKELSLHTNLKRHDVITYYTTCGWMMWNWLISSLMVGAAIYLYEGNPAYPNASTLWKMVDKEGITIFGTSPKFLKHCQNSGLTPKNLFKLDSLKTILSTSSPLTEEQFEWVYKNVKQEIQLSSISGGTDIISCFMLGNPLLPVYAGEIQCRGLGMKVEAFDEKGKSVINEKGELVCTAPFPSMPVYFWNDPDGSKYKSAYFEDFPGVWKHGDYIMITDKGGVIVYGRSDSTLNPGGIRIGTAEIYRIIESLEEITDSIVIGQKWKEDIRIILFVVLKEGNTLTKELIEKIKTSIRNSATPRHVPAKIVEIKDIPRTINGKKVEIAVTKLINGEKIKNKEVLANPESLKQFENILHLLSD